MKQFITIYTLLFLNTVSAFANTEIYYTKNCIQAQHFVFNLEFDKAESILKTELKNNPENLIPIRLLSYIDFIKSFLTEEEQYHQQFKSNTKDRIDYLRNNQTSSPFNKMIQGEITLQLSISEFKAKEFLSAAWDLRKAYKLLNQNGKEFPNFQENNLGLGMLHTIIGATPERYKWIMSMAGMSGELDAGINELQQVYMYCEENNLADKQIEVTVIRLLTELHINKNFAYGNNLAHKLLDHQSKVLILFTLSHYYMNTGNTLEAYNLLQKNNFNEGRFPFLYMYFMRGLTGLNQLKLNESTYNDINKFVTEFKGTNFIKVAYQKMAWYKFLTGDTITYQELINKCLTHGEDFTDEDKQAIIEANRKSIPNLHLLKARVLFDGGFFNKSRMVLENVSASEFSNFKDKTEYNYRLARAVDAINDDAKTVKYYTQTIELSKNEPWYYAANSALHLGIFYEEKGKYALAEKYYSDCFNMNNTEYKNSIRQKAKTGLYRLKHK